MNGKHHHAAGALAFMIWGFFSLPLKALDQFPAGEILYFRMLFTLLFVAAVIVGFKRESLRENIRRFMAHTPGKRKQVIWLTLAGGLLLGINWLTFIYIVNSVNIRTASFSYLICPVVTAVLGSWLLKERISFLQWVAVALCGISCVMIGLGSALELKYSLLTALTYALFLITQRKNQGFDRAIMLGIQVLFSFLILSAFFGVLVQSVPVSLYFYGMIVVIALFFTLIPLFLNLYALNRVNAATIGILMYLNPLINFGLAVVVFKERLSPLQTLGYIFIGAGLVLFNVSNIKKLTSPVRLQKFNP